MKKTKTNQSKTEELYELVASLSPAEVIGFEQYAKRKRSNPEYWRLFDHLKKIHTEQKQVVEQIREGEIKALVVGTNQELWGSYRSLCRNLYRSLLAFLTEDYKSREEIQWREKVMKGLDEVEALADRKFYKQAASRLIQVEQWVPARPNGFPWEDLSPITRLGTLKLWLSGLVNFLQITKDDEAMSRLYSIAHIFRSPTSPTEPKDLLSRLNLEGRKMFIFRVIQQILTTENSDQERLSLMNDELKRIQSSVGLEKLLKRYANSISDAALKSRLLSAFTNRLSLRKVGLLLDMGKLGEALNEMNRFQRCSEHELAFSALMLLSAQQQEIGLARAISKSNRTSEFSLEAEYLYTEQLIQDLPIRVEVNAVLMQASNGEYQEALDRTIILMKKRLASTARKSFVIELKFLECVSKIELAASGDKFDFECIRRLRDAIHNHDGTDFEKAALKIIDGVGYWVGNRRSQKHWLIENEEHIKTLKQAINPSNPLHQFFLYWTRRIRDSNAE